MDKIVFSILIFFVFLMLTINQKCYCPYLANISLHVYIPCLHPKLVFWFSMAVYNSSAHSGVCGCYVCGFYAAACINILKILSVQSSEQFVGCYLIKDCMITDWDDEREMNGASSKSLSHKQF